MSLLSFGLLLAACVASLATEGATEYVSPSGIFRHHSSGKYAHYVNFHECPYDDWTLVVKSGYQDARPFRFVQVIGHYGYLVHECPDGTEKILFPHKGLVNPEVNTYLVFHHDRQSAALWTIDQENMIVYHRSGMHMRPRSWSAFPDDYSELLLHNNLDYTARFEFVHPSTLEPIDVFPVPDLSGYWKLVIAIIDPIGDYEVKISYSVGKSVTKQAFEEYEWTVSAGASFLWFETSVEYRQFAQLSQSETWEVEAGRELTIKVFGGQTVVTWQYFFEAEQFDDGFMFRSTIIADTDDINTPPVLSQLLAN